MTIIGTAGRDNELAHLVNSAMAKLASTQVERNDQGFTRWSPALWATLASDGWLDLVAEVAAPDDDSEQPQDEEIVVREAEVRLDAVGAFEYHLVPGPVADTVGFVLPFLRLAGATEPLARELRSRVENGEVVVSAGGWALSFGPTGERLRTGALELHMSDGEWRLTGTVRNVSCAGRASVLLLAARTDQGAVAVAVVPADRQGVTVKTNVGVDPRVEPADLVLDVVVGAEELMTGPALGQAVAAAEGWRALVLNALAVGGGAALIERTQTYVGQRHQFGQPIGAFQAIKHQVADMHTFNENGRAVTALAAESLLRQSPTWLQDVLAARLYLVGKYGTIAELAIQCHGGFGFTWEQQLHYWYKSALFAQWQPRPEGELRRLLATELGL